MKQRVPATISDEVPLLARNVAVVGLFVVLMMLAFRLTALETLRETLAQKDANLTLAQQPPGPETSDPIPMVGPVFFAAYAVIACLAGGAVTMVAGGAGVLTRSRMALWGLMGVLAALVLGSTMQAANRFNAWVGFADVVACLGAGWTVGLACRRQLLGDVGRKVVIAAVVGVLTMGTSKALLQKYDEFPTTMEMVQKDPDKALRQRGIDPNDKTTRTLFLSRLKSAEVSGFIGFSNVFATQMIACVALLAGIGMAGLMQRRPREPVVDAPQEKGRKKGGGNPPPRQEIPVHMLGAVGVGIFLAAGLWTLPMTGSKGGAVAAGLGLAAVVGGGVLWRKISAWRRGIFGAGVVGVLLLAGVVVGYGVTHHGLPSRSLLFRWQYWTGAAPIIQEHTWWGVGLHNFGSYYSRFKQPAWPEDVSDPHNFFVRWASECGVPAMLAAGALVAYMLWRAVGRKEDAPVAGDQGLSGPLILGGVGAALWVPLHFLVELPNEYTVALDLFTAAIGWLAYAAVLGVGTILQPGGVRMLGAAAAVSAAAMLLYDQVNMALVTGPVAMLFWVLLAVGDAEDTESKKGRAAGFVIGGAMVAGGFALAFGMAFPMGSGSFDADPAPYEMDYLIKARQGDPSGAIASLNEALARSPNSIELLVQRMKMNRDVLHVASAADARSLLALDRSNAAIRLTVALPESDLPAAERRKALEEALLFDDALDPTEPKRLTAAQVAEVKAVLGRLQGQ